MYKRQLSNRKSSKSFNPFVDKVVEHHEPSYYARGGLDMNGSQRPPLPTVRPDAEEVAAGVVDITTDPRVSRLDIAVEASQRYTEKEQQKVAKEIKDDVVE